MSYFELGGVRVEFESSTEINQRYEDISASSIVRFNDGSAAKQTAYTGKIRIITQGKGWYSLGLGGLDWSASMLMKCAFPISISDPSISIDIPSARRSDIDYTPIGFAVVAGELVKTNISISVDTVTLTVVPGATAYRVDYWPELTVFANAPDESWGSSGNDYDWSFIAEQI